MKPIWIPIVYRDFWDVPRAILMSVSGRTLYLLSLIAEDGSDFDDAYTVYELPMALGEAAGLSNWIGLETQGRQIGRLAVSELTLDKTRRKSVDAAFLTRMRNI